MQNFTIGIIGAGNMGLALATGLTAGYAAPAHIGVYDRNPTHQSRAQALGLTVCPDAAGVVAASPTVVLAVKPQGLRALCHSIAPLIAHRAPLFISVAAGVRGADIDRWLGGGQAVVRAMPNTPALIQAGTTALWASPAVSDAQRTVAAAVLGAVSQVFWLADEALMDAATALSGSGPAYVFLLAEALAEAGVAAGLPADLAAGLTANTILGAARMLASKPADAAALRAAVTSPGGTTERAVASLLGDGFREMWARAILAARDRSRALGAELGAL